MKPRNATIFLLFTFVLVATSCRIRTVISHDATTGATSQAYQQGNSLYHKYPEARLNTLELSIQGEIVGSGPARFDGIYPHEVVVKETLLNQDNEAAFVGAYRYNGYSLFDLLHPFVLDKKNAAKFKPSIDAYILVLNDKGDSVTFSWSEVFHTINPHQIIIATSVAPIKPYRREVDFPQPLNWKLVAGGDLFAHRFLDNPTKIIVKSFDEKDFPITRNMEPLFSAEAAISFNGKVASIIPRLERKDGFTSYQSTFYGMGMGYHPVLRFDGVPLRSLMPEGFSLSDAHWMQKGLICVASADGYRAVFSFSELFNRNDHALPLLVVPENPTDGGYYRIFLPTDFYADRSVKAIKEIYLFTP